MCTQEDFTALLAEMKEYGEKKHVPIININALEILLSAVEAKKPHRVLEIGTAIGYSALHIASKAADNVEIITLELSEERAAEAQSFIDRSCYKNNIHIVAGDAGENIFKQTGSFDFVFIDAAKGQYVDYFHKVYPLLTEDAVVAADNVLFRGYVRDGVPVPRRFKTIVKRLREYIELVSSNGEFTTRIYENGDGLAVSQRMGGANL